MWCPDVSRGQMHEKLFHLLDTPANLEVSWKK